MAVFNNISETVGGTPLLRLSNISNGLDLEIVAKLEYRNPTLSIKDRAALSMIDRAREEGLIDRDTTIVEASSGNTGIALASIAAWCGYKLILVMPENMSDERKYLLELLGAELVLTLSEEGIRGAIRKAEDISSEIENSFFINQFKNAANPEAHYKNTAEEILKDLDSKLDILVAGVGTGGTITGIGECLKERVKDIKIIAVEPESSAVLSGTSPGAHSIEGIGAGFIPDILKRELIDEIIKVSDGDAFLMVAELAKREGVLAGPSSGAALAAALEVAKRESSKGKRIVVIFPDSIERYISEFKRE
ncbi:MAG: cysteine synthase A [Candidatus Kaelpia imicola]|nr:cysteine synthase A [Candidatus Kaelpia imicola]